MGERLEAHGFASSREGEAVVLTDDLQGVVVVGLIGRGKEKGWKSGGGVVSERNGRGGDRAQRRLEDARMGGNARRKR